MTVATEIFYSGYHPYTLQKVDAAIARDEKKDQNIFFFWYKPENKPKIAQRLKALKREDLLDKLLESDSRKGFQSAGQTVQDSIPKWLKERREKEAKFQSEKKPKNKRKR